MVCVSSLGAQLLGRPGEDLQLEIIIILHNFLDGVAIFGRMGGGRGHVAARVPGVVGLGEDQGG